MKQACFAILAREMQCAMQPPNDDKDIVELLLGWITDMPGVVDKKGNPINLAPSLVSDLLNQKVEVPKAIKNACTTSKMASEAHKHCKNIIVPYINPFTSADMFDHLSSIVNEDDTISDRKKKQLLKLCDGKNDAEFLAELLMYVISRPNKAFDTPVEREDISLLSESNCECPIYHGQLVGYIKNRLVKKYVVVNIYPDNQEGIEASFSLIRP